MSEMKQLYVRVADYISGVRDLKELLPVLGEIGKISPTDTFQRFKNNIIVEDDWIEFAEARMKYVEAAVFENRQFIREDGEVLPIERVKKISHNSISHLAKHSDYIEKYNPEEEEIIPSKIYTVNKDTDYGVYENKFLYLLLVTMTDFIQRERDTIDSCLRRDNGAFQITRQNELGNDEIRLELKMKFRSVDTDATLPSVEREKLARMDSLKSRAQNLLATPLMQVVSKEPMISSSITKTNVLSMNENFTNALELFEFLINYEKESFKTETVVETINLRSEFSFPMLALEVLVQGFKEDIMSSYDLSYKEIKSEEREKAILALTNRIEAIRKEHFDDPASFIVLLEDKITLLGEQNAELSGLKHEVQTLERDKEKLIIEKQELNARLDELNEKLTKLIAEFKNFEIEKANIRNAYEAKIRTLDQEIVVQKSEIQQKQSMLLQYEEEKNAAIRSRNEMAEKMHSLENERDEALSQYNEIKASFDAEIEKREEALRFAEARFTAIQAAAGNLTPEEAQTNKEAFDELEREYNAFTAYFEAVWERTKKEIKKEIKRKKG